jgi:hypothetical protein
MNVPGITFGADRYNPKSLKLMITVNTSVSLSENLLFFTDIYQTEARARTHPPHLLARFLIKDHLDTPSQTKNFWGKDF